MIKRFTLFILVLVAFRVSAQEVMSPKPGISIYGSPCLVGNLAYSCTPKTCDSVTIIAGDSIEFCTFQEIYLNTDTAYWMRWHFYGATNLPDTIHDDYPSATPICYWPRWDSAGTYIVEVIYNGWWSAYPSSECYSFGPSHWYIQVNVLPNPNSIGENSFVPGVTIAPNPSSGLIGIHVPNDGSFQRVEITDISGRVVFTGSEKQADLSLCDPGIYFAAVFFEDDVDVLPVVIE